MTFKGAEKEEEKRRKTTMAARRSTRSLRRDHPLKEKSNKGSADD